MGRKNPKYRSDWWVFVRKGKILMCKKKRTGKELIWEFAKEYERLNIGFEIYKVKRAEVKLPEDAELVYTYATYDST